MKTLETLGLYEDTYTALIRSGIDNIGLLQEIVENDWWNLYQRPPHILSKKMCKEIQELLAQKTL